MKLKERYFAPIEEVNNYVASKARGKVLELGPGNKPFLKATHFCGHSEEEKSRLENYLTCDFSSQFFPYKDKEFDFVYARHVVEDLYNPKHFLNECKRVSKAGYFETPSPLIETFKFIEGEKSNYKGYHHHFSFLWSRLKEINILHKYPISEYIEINLKNNEFLKDKFMWNNYFLWQDDFLITHWEHEKNFNTIRDYPNLLVKAVNEGIYNSLRFKQEVLKNV
jgi:predicted SAM-dependent methyltransferase